MTHTILIDCSDAKGLVHKVTGVLYHNDLNVVSNHEFVQPETGRFFMRTEIDGVMDADRIHNGLSGILPEDANVRISESRKKRIVILVTKEHHALGELLIRHQFGELNAEVIAVIGNHDILRGFVGQFGLPFIHISHVDKTREVHETEVLSTINELKPDYIILAKYMRVLTSAFVKQYPNQIINIHHSFLPAFIGANPYRQAYERGVKNHRCNRPFCQRQPRRRSDYHATSYTNRPHSIATRNDANGSRCRKNNLSQSLKIGLRRPCFCNAKQDNYF